MTSERKKAEIENELKKAKAEKEILLQLMATDEFEHLSAKDLNNMAAFVLRIGLGIKESKLSNTSTEDLVKALELRQDTSMIFQFKNCNQASIQYMDTDGKPMAFDVSGASKLLVIK